MPARIELLADDTAFPATADALVFEQDTELILRMDLPAHYPEESDDRLICDALAARGHTPGMVVALAGAPLRLLAIVHDLDRDPSWSEDWIAAAYAGVAHEVRERGLREIVTPLLGRVHGRYDRQRSRALLEAALRAYRVEPRVWLRDA